MEVLKDASATAIYGSRGANGVVLVTTKKGKSGKVSINYAGSVTISNIDEVTEFMSASEWLDYARYAAYNNNTYGDKNAAMTPNYDLDKKLFGSVDASWANIEKAWSGGSYNPANVGSYDWVGQGKQTGITQDHTLSVSGGSDRSKVYASFGYLKQDGTQPGQSFERLTGNTSAEIVALPYFTMGMTANLSYGHQEYGYNFSKSVTGAGDYYGALRAMLPWTVPYDANGNYLRLPNGDINIINPINEIQYNKNTRRTFRFNGSVYGELNFGKMYQPLEGLRYRIQFGPELRHYNLGVANAAEGINGDGNNKATDSKDDYRSWTLDNLVYFDKNIASHHLGFTLMQSASRYHYDGLSTSANVHTAKELWYNLGSASEPSAFGSGLTESSVTSYLIRGNYNYGDKYLLTASVRWDGSSVLSPGHKWASFPSVALGWRVDQENFMQNAKWLSMLKFRFGYGITGNAAISAYSTKGAADALYYNFGGGNSVIGYVPSDPSAKNPSKMANKDLGWEKTTQYNLGIDYGFIDGRINGSVDFYWTKTTDLLLPTTIPSLTGYISTYANVGETSGWGVDFQLNFIPIKTKDFTWNSTLTWSMDRDKIEKLANGADKNINDRLFVGERIGVYYDYIYDGIWKSSEAEEAAKYGRKPGQIKVKDVKADGKIDAEDRQIVGHVRPDWTGGWQNTFTYKQFDLSFFMVARAGFTVPQGSATLNGRYMMRKLDYWIKDINEDAEYYGPGTTGQAADTYASSMNYQKGSFVKMRNISLGYTFNAKQLKPIGLNSVKLYVQAQNPFTIYKSCKWLDTDMLNYDNNSTTYGSSTTIRSFVFGLNVGF